MGSNTVASKLLIHVVAMPTGVFSNDFCNLGKLHSGLDLIDSSVHTLPGDLGQAFDLGVNLSVFILEHHHGRVVSVAPFLEAHNIYVEVISSLQHVRVRNSVTHYVVYGEANRLGEVHKVNC
jgi:hypothetical protein